MRYVLPPGPAPALLSPLTLDGAKAADVLMAASLPDRVEVLAVTGLESLGKSLVAEDGRVAEVREMAYRVEAASG
jgi:hypothetical protein